MALNAAAVAPIPSKVAFRCSSELFLAAVLDGWTFFIVRLPKASSELADDEEELAKLKNPFLLLFFGRVVTDCLEKKPVNIPCCWGEDEREVFADVRFWELVNPRI
jgi:hypothetical protein